MAILLRNITAHFPCPHFTSSDDTSSHLKVVRADLIQSESKGDKHQQGAGPVVFLLSGRWVKEGVVEGVMGPRHLVCTRHTHTTYIHPQDIITTRTTKHNIYGSVVYMPAGTFNGSSSDFRSPVSLVVFPGSRLWQIRWEMSQVPSKGGQGDLHGGRGGGWRRVTFTLTFSLFMCR
jgi:hypothetical protein